MQTGNIFHLEKNHIFYYAKQPYDLSCKKAILFVMQKGYIVHHAKRLYCSSCKKAILFIMLKRAYHTSYKKGHIIQHDERGIRLIIQKTLQTLQCVSYKMIILFIMQKGAYNSSCKKALQFIMWISIFCSQRNKTIM